MKLSFDYLNNKTFPPLYDSTEIGDYTFKVIYDETFKQCSKCIHCKFFDELILHVICDSSYPQWGKCFESKG